MSKNKVKESGSFIKKEKVHWRLQLQQLDVNTIRTERNIEVVILNEFLTKYFDDIAKFQEHAYTYTCADVKPVIFEEILYIISHYPAWSRPYIENDVENMIKEACAEAKSYIKMKKPIPLDMMADLIKLRIIMLIEEDIYNEKLLHMNLLSETMSTELSDFCETASNSSIDEDEKIAEQNVTTEQKVEEGNDCKTNDPIMEYDLQNTAHINENLRDFETVDVFFSTSSIILQQYIKTQLRKHEEESGSRRPSTGFTPIITPDELSVPKRKKLRTPWSIRLCKSLKEKKENSNLSLQSDSCFKETKLLFIVLTGFYDPYLIISLYKTGVPVSCVINIAMKADKPVDPTEVTSTKRLTLLVPFSVAPVYNYSLQCLYTQSQNVVRICDLGYEEMKEQLIYHFWSTLEELSVSNYEIIKDLITVVCPPVDYRGTYVKPESVEYVKQSKTIFRNIKQLLYKLPVFKKWYNDYTSSLQILNVGDTPKVIPADEMFYYNETLDKIPADCYNVGLTVEGLLKEVEQMNSGSENKFGCESVSHESQEARKKECGRLLKIKRFCNKFCNKYQFKVLPSNILSFYQKHRSSFLLSRKKPYCPERFEITEGNSLELNAIYYPRFLEPICSRTLSDLEKSMPLGLRKLIDDIQREQIESIFGSNQHHAWSSLLRLSPQEINEGLEICMFDLLKCGGDDIKAELFCDLYNYFPTSTQSNASILLNRDAQLQTTCLPSLENIYEHYDETTFQWQESLEADLLLQKLEKYRYTFKCMDYEYIPFSNSIIMRFHDKCDDFGIATEIWRQGLRSQAGMRDFFKSVIFEDPCALLYSHIQTCKSCEEALMSYAADIKPSATNPVDTRPEESISSTPLINSSNRQTSTKFNTSEASLLGSPHLMNAFNLHRRHEARCMSTIFRSLDGLKVTVEKTFSFSIKPCLKLKLETNHHKAFMYVQQHKDSKFTFHMEAANGARVVFSQPEARIYNQAHDIITTRIPRPKQQRYYDLKEIETIKFGGRLRLYEMHFLNELSLLRILNEYLPLQSLSSTETLQLLDARRSIVLKPTASLTDMRWRCNVPKAYAEVLKAINTIKRESIPHFRIISTALHKHRYIVIAPLKIKISFANGEKILKYTPNLITKKKIEISKCVPLLSKLKDSLSQSKQFDQQNIYDTRLSLPNGLQVASEPGEDAGSMHIIQFYIPNNPNMPQELSRTYTQNGCIQIRYNDGTIKLIGIQGKCIIGELPCTPVVLKSSKKERKRNTESLKNKAMQKYMKFQRSILRKIYRYQSKFMHLPARSNLRSKLKRKEVGTDNFGKMRSSVLRNSIIINNQVYPVLDFHVQENCFEDYFTLDSATKDSHSSITDDGELITIYSDGTKITSCCKIDQEMIVVDETEPDIFEIDPDDYTCNFLIPKVGGWISISLFYQYEHPQYATVVCYGKKETCIRLPDVEYKADANGNFVVNIKEEVFARVTNNKINISSNYCKTCHQFCETTINVKNLWSSEAEVKEEETLLETKDTFHKVFTVDYRGRCYKNNLYQRGYMTTKCTQHKTTDSQKFLVFDKHFKGKMFWSKQKLRSKLIDVENCNELKTREYLDENGNLKVYDFVRYHRAHYSDRFLMEYRNPNPSIFSYQFQKELQKITYTTKRQVSSVSDNKQVLLLFSLIKSLNIKYAHELPLPKFENILQLEKYLQPKSLRIKSSSTDTINMKLSPLFGDVIVHNFKKLMQKVDKFDIGANENVEDFEKSLEGSDDNYESLNVSDECSETYFVADKPAHEVHPKILYREVLKHSKRCLESPPYRKKKQKAVEINNLEPPPVPKNSHISVTCQDSPLESAIYTYISSSFHAKLYRLSNDTSGILVLEACGRRVVSHSEFLRNVNKHLSLGKDKSISQKQIEVIHEKFPSNIVEWRKPISTMESGSSVSFSLKNVAKSVPVNNKDKGVCTTTAFDLFFDNCQEVEEDIASRTKLPSSSKENLQKHGKVLSPEFTWQQFDTSGKGIEKSETLNPENKQSKLITGVQAIESYNQVYDKFKTLHKDAPKDMKRFTELQRTIGEKQSLRRTSAVTELQIRERFLPLILSTQKISSHREVNDEFFAIDVSSNKVEKLSSIRTIKENGSQSRTLKPSSREEKFLKYVLPEIEQAQGRFYVNLIGRDESECSSVTTKASLDVHCHSIEKECFCPSQNINGKPERSDGKTSRGSRKFSKLNKEL